MKQFSGIQCEIDFASIIVTQQDDRVNAVLFYRKLCLIPPNEATVAYKVQLSISCKHKTQTKLAPGISGSRFSPEVCDAN